ncbi:MAG: hypothetical protein IJI53_12920 [Clostridia bacterium]|nr:hypothetical protein [Clostridia bacterium]
MFKTARFAKVALFAACLTLALCFAASASAGEVHVSDHVWVYTRNISGATCSNPPINLYTCSLCGATEERREGATDPNAHIWGEWIIDTAASCVTSGTRHRQCQLNVHHTQEDTIQAYGHSQAERVVQVATCTTTGLREIYCPRCGQVLSTEVIPATDHNWGPWTTIKQPTCFEAGEQTHTCTNCGKVENAPYGATLGHNWGPWTVITAATCEGTGQRTRVCQRDASHVENEIIAALGHNWGPWVVTKQANFWEDGERTRTCTVCGKVQTEKIPSTTYPNATLCAFGPRLKESNLYPNYSDKWYMFTPFDASMNGVQTYELVAADQVIVGSVTLTIRDGYLTIDYDLKGGDAIRVTLEFFTVLNRIADINQYEPEGLMQIKLNRNQPINLAEKFGGDTHLVLYFCSRCSLTKSPAFTSLQYNSSAHKALLSTMYALMD